MKDPHTAAAQRYFERLARFFPVMCASDEFHFLPRAAEAARHYDKLEDLSAGTIADSCSQIESFRADFVKLAAQETDLEQKIDLELLAANAAAVLIELSERQLLQHNPLIYLKIAAIGLDHALFKPADRPAERLERTAGRLRAIPRLLGQAVDNLSQNLDQVPEMYHTAARAMTKDCMAYLGQIGKRSVSAGAGNLEGGLGQALSAFQRFERFLGGITPRSDQHFDAGALQRTLKEHFLSLRSLDEIYQIALDEWQECLEQLARLQGCIASGKSWQRLYHEYQPQDCDTVDTIALYRREIDNLRRFFSNHGFSSSDLAASLEIAVTPAYLRSVRSSASFAAAFTADPRETSFFYITTRRSEANGESGQHFLKQRLLREYKFLTAHETIPGHHLLDTIRRRLNNPVRRQIESPLFYEGWAYYAESLLTESGYVARPIEALVDYKRRLWRAARCQIDVGFASGKLDFNKAMDLLATAGFTPPEARRQIDRFQLNPGYQLCYSLGRYEIMQLKRSYDRQMTAARFHAFLLEGGQLPFHFIEKRLQKTNPQA